MVFSGLASPLQYRLDVGSLVEFSKIVIFAHITVINLIDGMYACNRFLNIFGPLFHGVS